MIIGPVIDTIKSIWDKLTGSEEQPVAPQETLDTKDRDDS